MKPLKRLLPALFAAFLVPAAGCDEDVPTRVPTGRISVTVVDISTVQPMPGIAVTIAGTGLSAETDAAGAALFTVEVGDYFVDARVCCVGPGLIDHHVPVSVAVGETAAVTLHGCTSCE